MKAYKSTPKDFSLRFSYGNDKLIALARMLKLKTYQVAGFGLLAGLTCPSADLCKAYHHPVTHKLVKEGAYSCFMAVLEGVSRNLYKMHKQNTKFVGQSSELEITKSLLRSIDDNTALHVMRCDTSGDFFTDKYLNAWLTVAKERPHLSIFGYTKELTRLLHIFSLDLPNFKFVYSYGSKHDLAAQKISWLPYSKVVLNEQHAADLGLEVACPTPTSPNDYVYIRESKSFALLAHSTGTAGLKKMAAKAAERNK